MSARLFVATAAAWVALTAFPVQARSQAAGQAPLPEFLAATIKPNESGCCTSSRSTTGRMVLTNETLKNLIVLAYEVQPGQVTGPDWMGDVRFDITATYPPTAKNDDRWLMLRELLKSRFGLAAHIETTEISGYSLQVSRTGFKLKPSPPGEGYTTDGTRSGVLTFNAVKATMSDLTYELADDLGEVVVDQTGLEGEYDYQLRWSANDATASTATAAAPSVFTALRETLGLQLTHGKVPAQIIVVDHVERVPTENESGIGPFHRRSTRAQPAYGAGEELPVEGMSRRSAGAPIDIMKA